MSEPVDDVIPFFTEVAATHARCFWLDGGGAREWSGRRSMLGWLDDDDVSLTFHAAAREVRRHVGGSYEVVGSDIFEMLERELAEGTTDDQWFGYFGYAARPELFPASPDPDLPDAVWMRCSHVRFFDHPPPSAAAIGHERHLGSASSLRLGPIASHETPPQDYAVAYGKVQEHLHAGNTYEVNLTYRVETTSDLAPLDAYVRLREVNPAPYAGFLQHDVPGHRAWLLSSSPERYALVTSDRVLETKPIKGTTPRGATAEEDDAACVRLSSDPKYRSENLMIVDLLRNDLSMVCDPGTVEVPVLMDVESYPSVHQLVSTVRGRLAEAVTTVQALRVLFPAGSMTGAPKLRTMQVIEEVEVTPRGVYAGAFGWLAGDGRADLGVVIRSLTTSGDGTYLLGTGGGITVRSDVDGEYAESLWKAERLLAALGDADQPDQPQQLGEPGEPVQPDQAGQPGQV
jgi:para-aminobenzoate synthetase